MSDPSTELGDVQARPSTVTTSTEYHLSGVQPRKDRRRRTYQPETATVIVRNGTAESITLSGPITTGLAQGTTATVVYPIIDGAPTPDGRVEQEAPYWLQQIVNATTITTRRPVNTNVIAAYAQNMAEGPFLEPEA